MRFAVLSDDSFAPTSSTPPISIILPPSSPIRYQPNDSSATYTTPTSALGMITKICTTQLWAAGGRPPCECGGIVVLRSRLQVLHMCVHRQCDYDCARGEYVWLDWFWFWRWYGWFGARPVISLWLSSCFHTFWLRAALSLSTSTMFKTLA